MFGARIRRKAVPYVTTEIAGEMELFPAPKWPSAASDEIGVPLGTCWERANDYATTTPIDATKLRFGINSLGCIVRSAAG